MQDKELRYETVDKNMKNIDELKALYNTAFPPEERIYTIDQALNYISSHGGCEVKAVYDADTMIGFYAISVQEEYDYKYLQFIATNPNIRGKGYGGKILRKLLEENKDRVFFASIERPDDNASDDDIKARRKEFYERNGMISVDRSRIVNGVEFIVVTNKIGDDFERCYKKEMEEEKKQFADAEKNK